MFTGLVEEVGTVAQVRRAGQSASLAIRAPKIAGGIAEGDSVSVNGVCLTATKIRSDGVFFADATPETLSRTSLSSAAPGRRVNLERAMRADGRFGGHIVSGHIDGAARLASLSKDGNSIVMKFSAPPEIMRYVVEKGSVALDGVSLTVASVSSGSFTVSVIPHTFSRTALAFLREGAAVNVECDVLAKYAERFFVRVAP